MLVELLRPLGAELARRWLAALLSVDSTERESMVSAMEKLVAEKYPLPPGSTPVRHISVVQPPVQRDGYVEQVETIYEVKPTPRANRATRNAARGRR